MAPFGVLLVVAAEAVLIPKVLEVVLDLEDGETLLHHGAHTLNNTFNIRDKKAST